MLLAPGHWFLASSQRPVAIDRNPEPLNPEGLP